jgi:predicted nucleotidyltransferase
MKTNKIVEKINIELPILKEKYHVKKMGVFGSFARGEENKKSDIDILVEFDSPIGFFDFIRLENYLSRALHKKVDLVSTRALKLAVKKDVLKEVIYV